MRADVRSNQPRYRLNWSVLAGLAAAGLAWGQRGFGADARRLANGIDPPLRVLGTEHIPPHGPGVITVNHYWSPTFWTPWLGIAISAVTPAEVTWTMTTAWTYPGRRLEKARRQLSQALLRRVAQVYGFIGMPPMPPDPCETAERAAAVRRLLGRARQDPRALFGFAPEGSDQPGGVLGLPPTGTGRLALALARSGFRFYLVGVFEEDGRLCLNFGIPYCLEESPGETRELQDLLARQRMMAEIAALVPARLRGEFAELPGRA